MYICYLEYKNFASRFVNIKVAFGWIFGINARSSQKVNYIIWSIYISIISCYLFTYSKKREKLKMSIFFLLVVTVVHNKTAILWKNRLKIIQITIS